MDQLENKKNILITGATGFIGKNLLKRLEKEDYNLVAVVRKKEKIKEIEHIKKITCICCELKELGQLPDKLREKGIDHIEYVIHLAWEGNSGKNRADYSIQMMNVFSAIQCAKQGIKLGCKKFIGIGTVSENLVSNTMLECVSANMVYAAAKLSSYYMLRVLCKEHNMKFVWCRLGNIYGAGNETGNLMSYTLDTLLKGERPTYSSARVWQDFVFIDDCVEALVKILQIDIKKDLYYIGTGKPAKLKEYLLIARDVIDPKLELGIGERADDGLIYEEEWFDISSLQEETGYTPKTIFKEGIMKTIQAGR